jgi:hypothetical protein
MTRNTTLVLALWAMLTSTTLVAQKGTEQQMEKEANALFNSGEFLKAYPLFSQLVSLYPNQPDYNYKFGACAIFSDPDKTKAIKFLNSATKKSVEDPMVWYYLGKAYHLNYQFKEAVKSYEKFLATADAKTAAKTDAQHNIETCIYGTNLLSNVKDVTVISKTESDKQNFFRYMNLDDIGGKIVTVPEELKSNLDKKSKTPGVIHYPGNSSTIYFSSLGKDGQNGKDIYSAQLTADGKYTNVQPVAGDVNSKYDEDFCFMHSDGKTLYFSSKGHNSMGGFDIFKSERDPQTGQFGKVINLDFAINTPDDDIFYIADSLNQRAYFASARGSDLDHMHVYNVLVTSQPMHVIYLKGLYANTIDTEELKATFQIVDNTSNKITSDGTTNGSSGDYLGYVEHSGEFTMKVKTANSPTIHEVKMTIPKFDKPVALRQEMKLVSEGGQEKLIVTNFFDTPLESDLSELAADMLRRKAKLDVNAMPDNTNSAPAVTANLGNKEISQVSLAAGFGDAETPEVVAQQMHAEVAELRASAAQGDERSKIAQTYAATKYQEAEASLKEAETLRKSTSGFNTEEDLAKIKASLSLMEKANEQQREAEAALALADMEDKQVIETQDRAAKLEEQERTIQQSVIARDYDAALTSLTNEKQRRQAKAPSTTTVITETLTTNVVNREKDVTTAEAKLTEMRNNEVALKSEVKAAEVAMNEAKKEKDKQATEFAYINKKSELDALRKNIKTHQTNMKALAAELADADADQALYAKLIATKNLGLSTPAQDLMETERLALGMKLKGMDNRLASLEITDQSTLALLGEMETNKESQTADLPVANDVENTNAAVIASVEKGTPANASIETAPSSRNTTPTTKPNLAQLESQMQLVTSTPALQPAKRMMITQSIAETDRQIEYLEKLKRENNITVAQNNELTTLNSKRNELQVQLATTPAATIKLNDEETRAVYTEIAPDYSQRILAITNGNGTAVDQAMNLLAYRKELHAQIAAKRLEQTTLINVSTDNKTAGQLAAQDARMEVAQQKLMSEPTELALLQGAYESENKSLIESDAVYGEKLQDQISLTENYIANLAQLIKTKQIDVDLETDQAQAIQMRTEIGTMKQELEQANNKLESYLKDLQLTASASTPPADKTAVAVNSNEVKTTKSEIKVADKAEQEQLIQEDTKTIETVLKPRLEQESIFAYESSIYEEILAKYETPSNKLNNRDKIQKINDEIFLIEAEMENEKNESKLRKLDYRAEQMYLQRAEAEVENAPAISTMTLQAYGEESTKASDATESKESAIEQSSLVKDEIRSLTTSAQNNMMEAEELRKAAPLKDDAIEKADMYRLAFAKEALAIQQLKQVQDIAQNVDVLTSYSDAEIASMRNGRPPQSEATVLPVGITASAPTENTTTTSTVDADIATTDAQSTKTASEGNSGNSTGIVKSETLKGSDLIQNNTVALKGDGTTAPKTDATIPTAIPTTQSVASEISDIASATSATKKADNNFPVAPRTSTASEMPKNASAAMSSSDDDYSAENYLFSAPAVLKGDLFMRTSRPVYSENKPIPVDMTLPQGIYYKVQVGAFRNDIPQNLYDQFAPVCGEKISNGITRYTAGFFITLNSANDVKAAIRSMGYSDAFVVAYRDGKRIPIYEALAQANGNLAQTSDSATKTTNQQNFQKEIEKEYIQGDAGSAPQKSTPVGTPSTTAPEVGTTTTAATPPGKTNPNYYINDGKAVQADQVEKIEGLFFTVQVGVYSKPVNASLLGYITPLNTELLKDSKLRYTSGRYTNMKDAAYKRDQAKSLGINDAFITAYYNGVRITISEADRLLSEKGPSVLAK